jgi:Zn-dependent protease
MDGQMIVALGVVGLVIYGTSLHEMAHAYVATWLGDPTPGRNGRLTSNPIPHLTPFLTAVVLPLVGYLSFGSMLCMAYTPIDPTKFRRPLRDRALVAVAGPITNLLFMGLLVGILWLPGVWQRGEMTYLMVIAYKAAFFNLMLACFNLLPIPPLDGYWIIRGALPLQLRMQADTLARNPMIGLLLVFVVGSMILGAMIPELSRFFDQITPNRRW